MSLFSVPAASVGLGDAALAAVRAVRDALAGGTVKPYYEHAGITIYRRDCRIYVVDDLAPYYGDRLFDLLLTDPPYGIGVAKNRSGRVGQAYEKQRLCRARRDGLWRGDLGRRHMCQNVLPRAIALSRHQIIFGGNYYELPPTRCWLVWDKVNEGTDFARTARACLDQPRSGRSQAHISLERHVAGGGRAQRTAGVHPTKRNRNP